MPGLCKQYFDNVIESVVGRFAFSKKGFSYGFK